jgi:hypothetical protein
MAYSGKGTGKRLDENTFWGRSEQDLDDAIRAAVDQIPGELVESRQSEAEAGRGAKFVVTSITVEVVGDPNVGAYSVIVA